MLEKLMKFKASKKTSLLLSLFCILMCVTVLIGTSFAWFTDTVTSGSNRIQTGTLKVGMEYRTVTLGQTSQSWKDANGAGDILDPDALYEPGYVSLTLFRIENKGSLSFKYQLALKLAEQQGINVFGEPFKLSDYLSFNLIPLTGTDKENALGATATYQREDALALLNNNPAELGFNAQNTVDAVMPVKENGNANDKYDVVALVIYMPETVGNKAMYDTTAPSITLDFKLVATQYTDEKDSFDQYYDEKAVYNDENNPVRPNWTAFQYIKGDLANELVCYDGTGFPVVKVKSDAPLNGTLIVSECNAPIGFNVTAGTIYKSYNISVVDDNGNPVAGDFTVQMYVGEGYPNLAMYHNGVAMADGDYSYNPDDGYVTFTTDCFSVFTAGVAGISAKIGDKCYSTIEDAFNAVHDGEEKTAEVKLLAKYQSITSTLQVNADENITLDLNGCLLSSSQIVAMKNSGELTIKDSSRAVSGIVSNDDSGLDMEYETGDKRLGLISSTGKLNVESGTIKVSSKLSSNKDFAAVYSKGEVNISGGEIIVVNDRNGTYYSDDPTSSIGLFMDGGKLTMSDGLISCSSSSAHNNAMKLNNCELDITGGSVYSEADGKKSNKSFLSSIWILGNTHGTVKGLSVNSHIPAEAKYITETYGVRFETTGDVTFDDCNIVVDYAQKSSPTSTGATNYGIIAKSGVLVVKNSKVTVNGFIRGSIGIFANISANLTLKDTEFIITDKSGYLPVAVKAAGSAVIQNVERCSVTVSGKSKVYGYNATENSNISIGTGNSIVLDSKQTYYSCNLFAKASTATLTLANDEPIPAVPSSAKHLEWSN